MKAGQVLVIIAAIGMLVPGGCLLVGSIAAFSDPNAIGLGLVVLAFAGGFVALSVYLFRLAIRWNRPAAAASAQSVKPPEPPAGPMI